MPYKCHDFCDGQVLSAKDLNEMDTAIAELKKAGSIAFTTNAISLNLAFDGIGKVKIDFGDGTATEKLLNGEESFKHRYAGKETTHVVTIEGASNIKVFSAPKCSIQNIDFIANNSIEKVVLYDNNIGCVHAECFAVSSYFRQPCLCKRNGNCKNICGLAEQKRQGFWFYHHVSVLSPWCAGI